jgi:O-antigen ligase
MPAVETYFPKSQSSIIWETMTDASQEFKKYINLRLLLVCFVAACVGLSMALVSIAKLALFVFGFLILIWPYITNPKTTNKLRLYLPKHTARAVLIALTAFSLSLFWTTAETSESVGSIAKYGKLLMILLLPMLLRNRKEVISAIQVFVLAQIFLVTSSWMLFAGLPVPWATSKMAVQEFAVFSTYLDQGIMSAVAAAICWHLRGLAPGRFGQYVAIAIAFICMSNVLFVLSGRSGHVVSILLLSLAVMWQLKPRYRWTVVILPIVLLGVIYAASPKVEKRIDMVKSEVLEFSREEGASVVTGTSSGIRLHFWHRAYQSMVQSPLLGSGVGSWSNEYNRLEGQKNPASVKLGQRGNPHQEYLQWGVQLGVPGILLFLALLVSVFRDTLGADDAAARAAQSVLAALAVACLFNSSVYDALIGDFFCVALGLMLALVAHSAKSPKDSGQAAA